MDFRKSLLPAVLISFGFTGTAVSLENIHKEVLEACAAETKKNCSQVTRGQGRLLACF